jgi:hypothetical protein
MNIEIDNIGSGKDTKTILRWNNNNKDVQLNFQTIVRVVFSEKTMHVYVSAYSLRKIYEYDNNGVLIKEFSIPEKEGYQYRGLNKNKKCDLGISLLYAPLSKDYGNEWGDIEQYDFLGDKNMLGKLVDIYR